MGETRHVHRPFAVAPLPIQGPASASWHIVAGSGGSPLVAEHSTFGFTLAEIHPSGQIIATPYDHPVPVDYHQSPRAQPATATKSFSIYPRE